MSRAMGAETGEGLEKTKGKSKKHSIRKKTGRDIYGLEKDPRKSNGKRPNSPLRGKRNA